MLRDMEAEGRDEATADEQETLSGFTGWGQFPGLFNKQDYKWRAEREQLKGLMSSDEFSSAKDTSGDKDEPAWKAAKRATLNSHFTAPAVVDAHWKAAQRLGFKGGRYLEPSIGSGYYLGMMPEELATTTSVTGVELDQTTAQIAQKLYPSATIRNQGFEEFQAPDGFFDIAASNVPFGDYKLHEKRYNRHQAPIHDHFFLKSLDKVRPGGLVMHVTSTGTMDKGNDRIRKELAGKADLIAAIRMPGKTHGAAANTEVVTDLIILRKHTAAGPAPEETPPDVVPEPGFTGVLTDSLGRVYHFVDGKRVPGDHWTETTTVPDPDGGEAIPINQYFANNPDQVLGTTDRTGTMYGGNSPNVTAGEDFAGDLDAAIERLPEGIYQADDFREGSPDLAVDGADIKNGTLSVQDGKVVQFRDGAYHPMDAPQAHVDRVAAADDIRQSMRALISQDLDGTDSTSARGELSERYDAFVAAHGFLHETKNLRALADDPDLPLLLSLEKYDRKEKTAEKADIFSKNTIRPQRGVTSADDVTSGLGVSLNEKGRVDVEHIGELTGQSVGAVEDELRSSGIAFEHPEEGWQSRAEYLSGNVRKKLEMARAAAEHDDRFAANVTALESHQPEDIDFDDISAKLGAPWVPTGDMGAFAAHLLNGKPEDFSIRYVEQTGEWVPDYAKGGGHLAGGFAAGAWGTGRKPFMALLDAALNNKSPNIYDTDSDGKRILDKQATEDARGKIQDMRDEFREWLWNDDERRERLHKHYNDTFNNIRPMEYDGSYLSYPGMNPDWNMRPVQGNFVWQAITRGKGILAHEVGIGKTATMVAAAMELRRLGLAKKPAIVVPKATLEQMTADAQNLYPGARILSTAGMFDAKRRKETVSKIATGDYDMVIMSHDHMNMLPMGSDVQERFINQEIEELEAVAGLVEAQDTGKKSRAVKALEKRKANLEAKLKKSIDSRKDDQVTFEQTGIDQIFVDEAHAYKNLPVHTSMQELSGIPTSASDRATNMLMRTRWLQEQNNGRGVVFATGTPVSNSMAEMFNMQRYVQPEELEARGLTTFDAWANTFGEFETSLEPNLKGEYKAKTRFSKFVNIPELMQIGRQDLDVRRVDSLPPKILPDGTKTAAITRPNRRDHMVVAPASDSVKDMMSSIGTRAAAIEGQRAEKGADNTLSIMTDGRQGAVDVRLYDSNAEDHPDSKTNKMVRSVLDGYHADEAAKGTQLIFSDIGVHPNKETGFHLYGDIIDKLVAGGIPRDQIANFGALEGKARLDAAMKLRAGEIRVGIGGTDKLGTGLNVQTNLAAIHHLDVPYKPSAIEQRNGRGYRFGNQNEDIDIYNYVTESSLDEMSWGIVQRKDGFIRQAITDPKAGKREVTEEDAESLTPQQLMAAASGDHRILERVNLRDRVKTLRRSKARHARDQTSLKSRSEKATKTADSLGRQAEQISRDASDASKDFHATIGGNSSTDKKAVTKHLEEAAERVDKQEEQLQKNYRPTKPEHIGDVRGMKLHRHQGAYTLEGPSGQKYVTGGSLLSIENVIRNLPKRADKVRATIKQARTDAESIAGQIGRPFSRANDLETAQKELDALEKELKGGEPVGIQGENEQRPAQYALREAILVRMERSIGIDRYAKRHELPARKGAEKYARLHSAILQRVTAGIDQRLVERYAAKWDESKHRRASDGRFGDMAGQSVSADRETTHTEPEFTVTDEIAPRFIEPLNPVMDEDKFDRLRSDFNYDEDAGTIEWKGRPLLVQPSGDGWSALTGSHRIHAAESFDDQDVRVPVLKIEPDEHDLEVDGVPLWDALESATDDENRSYILQKYADEHPVLQEAADLMKYEIAANEQDDTLENARTRSQTRAQFGKETQKELYSLRDAILTRMELSIGIDRYAKRHELPARKGAEKYAAKHKSLPGQKSMFGGHGSKSGAKQSKIQWDESKHARATDGRFGNKAGEHKPKESSQFDLANHIKIAADDIGSLRKSDVFRLIDWAPGEHRQTLADHITKERPDLADEVAESLEDVDGDNVELKSEADPTISAKEDYEKNGTRAQAFKDWFGKSKVVDDQGEPEEQQEIEPLRMFHGTGSGGFEAFEKRWGQATGDGSKSSGSELLFGPGFYFTADPSVAEEYSRLGEDQYDYQPKSDIETVQKQLIAQVKNRIGSLKETIETGGNDERWGKFNTKMAEDQLPDVERILKDLESGNYHASRMVGTDKKSQHSTMAMLGISTGSMFRAMQTNEREVKEVYLSIENPLDIEKGTYSTKQLTRIIHEIEGLDWDSMPVQQKRNDHPTTMSKEQRDKSIRGMARKSANKVRQRLEEYLEQPRREYERPGRKAGDPGKPLDYHQGSFYRLLDQSFDKAKANWILQQLGHDGITHVGGSMMGDHEHRVWIAFDPNQIKSTDNQGTFDAGDDRMKYARGLPARKGAERYAAKHKSLPGQQSMFGGHGAASGAKQSKIQWEESKHDRATDGRFGQMAGQHAQKAAQTATQDTPPAAQKAQKPAQKAESLADLQKQRQAISDLHIWNNAMSKGSSRPAPPDTSELDAKIRDAKEKEGRAYWQKPRDAVKSATGMPEEKHKQLVKDALKAGKTVPENVLADYPDLQPKLTPQDDYAKNGTRAAAFKSWFGDWEHDPTNASKVVDENGEPQETAQIPKVMYHGTPLDFDAFSQKAEAAHPLSSTDTEDNDNDAGFFFTSSPEVAGVYAGESGTVLKSYLKITNPMEIGHSQADGMGAFLKAIRKQEPQPGESKSQCFKRKLSEMGYDGIKLNNTKMGTFGGGGGAEFGMLGNFVSQGTIWIAFEPNQIKAVDNAGTFDPSDDRMKYARGLFDPEMG